jgi:hypothetical protein
MDDKVDKMSLKLDPGATRVRTGKKITIWLGQGHLSNLHRYIKDEYRVNSEENPEAYSAVARLAIIQYLHNNTTKESSDTIRPWDAYKGSRGRG